MIFRSLNLSLRLVLGISVTKAPTALKNYFKKPGINKGIEHFIVE